MHLREPPIQDWRNYHGASQKILRLEEKTKFPCRRVQKKWCLGPESNRYGAKHRGILSAKNAIFLTP
jgi:hypothetical protein